MKSVRHGAADDVGEEGCQVAVVSGERAGREELEAFGQSCRCGCKGFEGPEGCGVVDLNPPNLTRESDFVDRTVHLPVPG
jgi:hypothetical protein